MTFIVWVIGFFFGFLLYKSTSAKKTGEKNRKIFGIHVPSVKFVIFGYMIHIHHWLYLQMISIFFGVIWMYNIFTFYELFPIYTMKLICGICCGGSLQGIYYYSDWHHVIYKVK
eukprot:TRINITY_DN4365_c0_g1_i1.p1 TRINITY_DN4365_c0_g1~~TRINITY_DN4365_c0_g1_i1.p1  ORF type:complete len:114 (-),score=2.69 TRINITY_DN4365_c0_g1_i1:103-444(-)